ncbi:bis(5'-nucleosyl)-tetraphosphatase (symmetrical) YqeK [uncultured Treponema sp.]|nr:bis(5'-nucleosyl)-tetraphosphatase (symmetrical) YqeK [uncultured Treponema sp.]
MSSSVSDIDLLTEKVRRYVKKSVSEKRYSHSVRTAEMCRKLCALYGLDEKTGYFAGISHDMCKNFKPEQLLSLAQEDGADVSELERKKPSLLHGRAAAVLLKNDFGVTDSSVLEAVANHTFGKTGMCSLAKVLYAADKIEPGREHVTEDYLARLLALSLDGLVKAVLEENIDYLRKKGSAVAQESEKLLESLQ